MFGVWVLWSPIGVGEDELGSRGRRNRGSGIKQKGWVPPRIGVRGDEKRASSTGPHPRIKYGAGSNPLPLGEGEELGWLDAVGGDGSVCGTGGSGPSASLGMTIKALGVTVIGIGVDGNSAPCPRPTVGSAPHRSAGRRWGFGKSVWGGAAGVWELSTATVSTRAPPQRAPTSQRPYGLPAEADIHGGRGRAGRPLPPTTPNRQAISRLPQPSSPTTNGDIPPLPYSMLG